MSLEYIDIETCPKCKGKHRYKLGVERAIVLEDLTISYLDERPGQVKISRLFTCPVKNEEFQASFILADSSLDSIKSVQVLGVANDNNKKG